MFDSLSKGLRAAIKSLRGKDTLTEHNMRHGLARIEKALLDADVSDAVVHNFVERVARRALHKRVLLSLRPEEELVGIVHRELTELLGPASPSMFLRNDHPTVILLCGLPGSGKTVTCGKLARVFEDRDIQTMLVAADLRRPAAIEQLKVIGGRLDVPVYSEDDSRDSVLVCENAIKRAIDRGVRVVILDTASRLTTDEGMMAELQRFDQVIDPDHVYLVVDGMTGQDALHSAGEFRKSIELDCVIMTKLDGDARGGALLSTKQVTGVPVKFIGTGEQFDALEPFDPEVMAGRILQMDQTLARVAERHRIDEQEKEELAQKKAAGDFTLDEYKKMIDSVSKPGWINRMIGLLPGMRGYGEALDGEEAQSAFKQTIGVIDSMTAKERRTPSIINTSRRVRIAKGAGLSTRVISATIKQFCVMKQMMEQARGGLSPASPSGG